MREALALTGAVLTLLALIPYIIDTLKKETKPNIVSWFTWSLLTAIGTAAAISAGEYEAALLTGANTVGTGLIVILGLRHGKVKLSKFDIYSQIGALISIAAWLILDAPVVAIFGVVIIDFFGVLPTIRHSWLEPDEETLETYVMSAVAPVFTLLSLENFNLENTLYPAYLGLADGLVACFIFFRREIKPKTLPERIWDYIKSPFS